MQEKLPRKAKIVEKEIERAKVSSSCGSSYRSFSPVGTLDDDLTKVSGWLDKAGEAGNVAHFINVQSVYPQTSVTAPVIHSTIVAWRTMHCASEGLGTPREADHIHRNR